MNRVGLNHGEWRPGHGQLSTPVWPPCLIRRRSTFCGFNYLHKHHVQSKLIQVVLFDEFLIFSPCEPEYMMLYTICPTTVLLVWRSSNTSFCLWICCFCSIPHTHFTIFWLDWSIHIDISLFLCVMPVKALPQVVHTCATFFNKLGDCLISFYFLSIHNVW